MDHRILAELTAAYEEKRRENEREEARRQAEIQAAYPDLARLIRQRHEMVMQSVRGAFSVGTPKDAEARMAEYNQKIAAALTANGYPADYLAPVCRCRRCGDAGYVYENAVQKPCECLRQAYAAALSRRDGGRELPSFDAFDETRFPDEPLPGKEVSQRAYMRAVRIKCMEFADGLPGGPIQTLLLHGGSGLGKTYLLRCVENAAREKGIGTLYITAYDLLMALKNAYFSRTGESAQEYFDVPLLLIDDLGMEPLMENITVEQIYHLLNDRLTRGLYTAVSTNLTRVELKQKYTERVSSRLLDARTAIAIPFYGRDIRLLRET